MEQKKTAYEEAVEMTEQYKIKLETCRKCVWSIRQEELIYCPFSGCINMQYIHK